ncbi:MULTISPECIES: motility protein A [Thermotoga]|jgi:chemotaxis protein MotA|uniref:MotA/TolQ/ExbB proton channel n=2 Tax=Thermotoga petrophila TaxID=93929 RepID=A5IJB1_THEP1|nr:MULTISPECIES: motility protein A [Thermotoga]KUK32965.1 MAG: MotA/TolQ/ExbB proton channel [Thermotoga sp. 47_83]MBZ4661387.1 MotA/TolQ/ExbB proton channel [Thermotoga sp.]HAA81779.1 motility protein A [Thermotoga petrophila]ABQ46284.1 MotA/TolQ/ExbB proton channel [Thermotoga petrophila RKU-1]ACB08612.1 MotA/TolQ/ExbB proton channel [Thermotoga sp. RQ2]
MDLATLMGLVLVIAALFIGILTGGGDFAAFINIPSLFITVVGSIAATMVAHPKDKAFKIVNIMLSTLKEPKLDHVSLIQTMVSFSEKARREGLLSLEENLESIEDPFMKKALQLVVDGTDPDLLRNMMETEMELFEEELDGERAVLESAGAYAPAFGMIGTLIGLIQMLKSLNNPETLGPSMAVALITTLYGAVLANGVFLPMAEKIKKRRDILVLEKRMILEAVLSIQAGENPRILEEKLKSFLPEKERQAYEAASQEATA